MVWNMQTFQNNLLLQIASSRGLNSQVALQYEVVWQSSIHDQKRLGASRMEAGYPSELKVPIKLHMLSIDTTQPNSNAVIM